MTDWQDSSKGISQTPSQTAAGAGTLSNINNETTTWNSVALIVFIFRFAWEPFETTKFLSWKLWQGSGRFHLIFIWYFWFLGLVGAWIWAWNGVATVTFPFKGAVDSGSTLKIEPCIQKNQVSIEKILSHLESTFWYLEGFNRHESVLARPNNFET